MTAIRRTNAIAIVLVLQCLLHAIVAGTTGPCARTDVCANSVTVTASPTTILSCAAGEGICGVGRIVYGNPTGTCAEPGYPPFENDPHGLCHNSDDHDANKAALQTLCVNKNSCVVTTTDLTLPAACPNTQLSMIVHCGPCCLITNSESDSPSPSQSRSPSHLSQSRSPSHSQSHSHHSRSHSQSQSCKVSPFCVNDEVPSSTTSPVTLVTCPTDTVICDITSFFMGDPVRTLLPLNPCMYTAARIGNCVSEPDDDANFQAVQSSCLGQTSCTVTWSNFVHPTKCTTNNGVKRHVAMSGTCCSCPGK